MISEEFPIGTKSITFCFECTECGETIEEETTDIPTPNFDAEKDTQRGTENTDSFVIKCPKCSKSYIVQFEASMLGGEIYSDDMPDDTEVIVEEEESQQIDAVQKEVNVNATKAHKMAEKEVSDTESCGPSEKQEKSAKDKEEWKKDKERLILYADFMGFKNRVISKDHKDLRKEMNQFREKFFRRMKKFELGGYLKFTQFSDSILIVVNGTDEKMMNLLTKAAVALFHTSMEKVLSIKGVIAQGIFTYDKANEIYFGRPLVDAYELHEKVKYYGVVVHHTAEKTVKSYVEKKGKPIYLNTPIYLEEGKVRHYHLCWNLVRENKDYINITHQCENWLNGISETVSGAPRLYIDKTLEIMHQDEVTVNVISFDCTDSTSEIGKLLASLDIGATVTNGTYDKVKISDAIRASDSRKRIIELNKNATASFRVKKGAKVSVALGSTAGGSTSEYTVTGGGLDNAGAFVEGTSYATSCLGTATKDGMIIIENVDEKGLRIKKITVTY